MNGTLGKAVTVAGQQVTPYIAPTDIDFATISLFLCNMSSNDAKIRIAISSTGTPAPEDHIEFDAVIPANGGTLERTCIPVSASDRVMVYSDQADVATRVSGLEQTTV